MIKKILYILITSIVFSSLPSLANASTAQVLITQVQAGASSGIDSAATIEYISIYNNYDSDIEITNWCITNKSAKNIACFIPNDSSIHLWLTKKSYATISSTTFSDYYKTQTDLIYTPISASSGSITGSSDVISLVDSSSTVIDNVSWNTTLSGGRVLERKYSGSPATYQDNDQSSDFTNTSSLVVRSTGLYEQVVLIDLCKNIDGIQLIIPSGYDIDASGDCVPDVCPNLTGLQTAIPTNMKIDNLGKCVDIDVCLNLIGSQIEAPLNYKIDDYSNCYIITANLIITEIMPNPAGLDTDREFIEFYNPTDQDVDLSFYKLAIGVDLVKYYNFPIGSVIKAGEYFVIYNSDINFTLVNTISMVKLFSQDNQEIFQSQAYLNPKDGESWSFIENNWQYTNQITPGKPNLASVIIETDNELQPCAPNQYRNPDTNRCKLITVKQNTLTPCKNGEYRSEETNRCRSIKSEIILDDCQEGQYRNPETNRCKKVAELTKADYPNNFVSKDNSDSKAKYFLVGILLVCVIYSVWEWRFEIQQGTKKLKKFIKKRK